MTILTRLAAFVAFCRDALVRWWSSSPEPRCPACDRPLSTCREYERVYGRPGPKTLPRVNGVERPDGERRYGVGR